MNKEFIPYEQALELRELGFEATPLGGFKQDAVFYYEKGELYYDFRPMYSSTAHEGQILAPLYQQAFRWFREKYNTTHEILRKEDNNHKEFIAWVYIEGARIEVVSYWFSTSYEGAELACLKKLIEIVKQK
jgi:hypothetical protein